MDLASIQLTVVLGAFALAFIFGALAQSSNYCTMGAVSDIATFGDWTRARLVLLSIASAILGTALLIFIFNVALTKSIYGANKLMWLSHLVGGLFFGFGMTIASGCGSKTILRAGGGSLKAVVTLLVMGIASYMTLRGLFAIFRVNILEKATIDLSTSQLLPQVFGLTGVGALAFACAVVGVLVLFIAVNKDFRAQPRLWLAGIGIGLTVAAGWWLTAKLGYLAEHPDTLQEAFVGTNSARPESFSFVAPVAYGLELLMFWSDKSRVLTFGIASVCGMFAGALAHALVTKSFRWESFANVEDLANHLAGGVLMGFGGVVAMGCTVGQGGSGLSVLSIGAILTVVAIVIGCRLALQYQMWRIEKTS